MIPTLKNDLAFGTANEQAKQTKLEAFFKTKLTHRGGSSTFDYDDGSTLFVELKSRRIPHNKYPTAIIGANKVETAANNPSRQYWFCYAYEDGLYGIEYSKELFDTFEHNDYTRGDRPDYNNKAQSCYFIPSKLLMAL
jgi:hypothetical protein